VKVLHGGSKCNTDDNDDDDDSYEVIVMIMINRTNDGDNTGK
jgi:hypothetical protein